MQNKEHEFSQNCFWLHLIHEGRSKERLDYCWENKKSLCYLQAIQGHSGGIPIRPEIMEYIVFPYNWKKDIFHKGISSNSQSIFGKWTNSGKKRERQSSTNSLFSSMNPFGIDPDEEKPNVDHTVSQKVHHQTHWKHTQDAVYWIKLSMTQDVKPSLLSAMWFSLHSFLVSCTWSTDCVCVCVCVSEAVLQQKQVVRFAQDQGLQFW